MNLELNHVFIKPQEVYLPTNHKLVLSRKLSL